MQSYIYMDCRYFSFRLNMLHIALKVRRKVNFAIFTVCYEKSIFRKNDLICLEMPFFRLTTLYTPQKVRRNANFAISLEIKAFEKLFWFALKYHFFAWFRYISLKKWEEVRISRYDEESFFPKKLFGIIWNAVFLRNYAVNRSKMRPSANFAASLDVFFF